MKPEEETAVLLIMNTYYTDIMNVLGW